MADGIVLYSYYCRDGVVRTRCSRHIEREGPRAIISRGRGIYHRKRVEEWWRCCRCHWEFMNGIRTEGEGNGLTSDQGSGPD